MTARIVAGQRFGMLVAVAMLGQRSTNGQRLWSARCDCGNKTVVRAAHLASGHSQSCGCLQRAKARYAHLTHGHSPRQAPSPTYNSWRAMVDRCRPGKDYARRGVSVCERWVSFDAFLADMGERPVWCEIDRINPLGNYCPENCAWTPSRKNRQHRRTTKLTADMLRRIPAMRRDGMTQKAIAAEFGVSKSAIGAALRGAAWGPTPPDAASSLNSNPEGASP